MQSKRLLALAIAESVLIGIGCAPATNEISVSEDDLRAELANRDAQIETLRSDLKSKDVSVKESKTALDVKEAELALLRSQTEDQSDGNGFTSSGSEMAMLPPNAAAGECYARVYTPPQFERQTDRVLKMDASEKLKIVPAEYEWVEEQVLVTPASKKLVDVPAKYEWKEERVLVKEGYTTWKRGRGLAEKVDDATGEIMCLVEVPAEYKTVRTRVMVTPPSVSEVDIPAEYKTMKVKRLVSASRTVRTEIPAEYQSVTRTVQITDGRMEWRRVLCETNMNRDVTRRVQSALKSAGHDPGPIDGMIGPLTTRAVQSYQKQNDLSVGALTYETMSKLGVSRP